MPSRQKDCEALNEELIEFGPQPGPQTDFLSSKADICIFGGAAGGSKTFGLLLDPLRHYDNPYFESVIFRRNNKQVRNTGGLWDTSRKIYPFIRGTPHETYLKWKFPSGFGVRFDGLEQENSVHDWQGSQIPHIGFDELTHFTFYQFMYMMSRNRSQAGTPGRVRATTNPDPDSWVRMFIDWWIDKQSGYPIKSRSGKLRYFVRLKDEFIWGSSKEEIYKKAGRGSHVLPKSVTFIPARLEDNKILMKDDPGYKATLLSMGHVDVERLYKGNWNIRATAGSFFRRQWFPIIDGVPGGWSGVTRAWDRAATEPSEANRDPDWSRGIKIYGYPNGKWVIADLKSERASPGKVERLIKTVAQHDGQGVRIRGYQDPGSAGVKEAEDFMKLLAGFDVAALSVSNKKAVRAKPFSRQCEYGNVSVVRGDWNDEMFQEFENFSEDEKEYAHDDIVDAASLAFDDLTGGSSMADVTEGLAAAFGLPRI